MKPGDHVRLTAGVKQHMRAHGSAQHIAEFGACVGVIEDQFDKEEPIAWNVRWQPSKLRYAYLENNLECVK